MCISCLPTSADFIKLCLVKSGLKRCREKFSVLHIYGCVCVSVAIIDEDILRYERVKKKAYVRMVTNFGNLNLELHSDMVICLLMWMQSYYLYI